MKKASTFLLAFGVFLTTTFANQVLAQTTPTKLRHVVLFKFKESSPATEIAKVEAAFKALPSKIKEIRDFEWGLNNSPEGLNLLGFLLTLHNQIVLL